MLAALAYVALAVAYTWPLASGLGQHVPWDLGDALLNDWILAWHYHQAGRLLAGEWQALATWWHPPIFHPAPYAIAYSELLVTPALLGAPVYLLTGNLLLTYNVLFLASFALSAWGAFLLVREITGDPRAGWVAGLLFGFALYRVAQAPHLQVLHAQWAPFVLYGLHRYFNGGRWRAAAGAGLALAAQNLSNGYYLFHLAILLPPYVIVQIVARRRVRHWRAWAGPGLTALVAAAITVPLMYPYLRLRALGDGSRPLAAVVAYGADTYAWLTASEALRVWGWLRTLPRPEGELFPGVVPAALAVVGLVVVLVDRVRMRHGTAAGAGASAATTSTRTWRHTVRHLVAWVAAASLAWHSLAIVLALVADISRASLGRVAISFGDGQRLLMLWALSAVALTVASRRVRQALRESPEAPVLTLTALLVMTIWLAYGPVIRTGGRVMASWPDAYSTLYAVVPGADALRVPPRVAMLTALLGAMLGGLGLAALRRHGWMPRPMVAILSLAIVAEAWVAPIPMNLVIEPEPPLLPVPASVPPAPARDPEAVAIAALPVDAVIVELPIGSLPHEIRWQYLAAGHWRARVNGYSGGFPDDYVRVEQVLGALPDRQAEAAAILAEHGVTHVVLRPATWRDPSVPPAMRAWLRHLDAAPIAGTPASLEIWALPRSR